MVTPTTKLFQGRQDKTIASDSDRVAQCNGSTIDVESVVFEPADGFGPAEFLLLCPSAELVAAEFVAADLVVADLVVAELVAAEFVAAEFVEAGS